MRLRNIPPLLFPILLVLSWADPTFAQVAGDSSAQSISPLTKDNLPKVKTSDPFVAHTQHSFYFQDTLASVLLKFTNSADFNAQDPASINDLGYIYYYFGEYADATTQFKKALELNPAFTDADINLGVTAYKTGDTDLALEYLNKAHDMDSARGEAAYDLGLIAFEKKEYSRSAG
ncbi:MAG TPA: tetratricopeptide repeat protein, partial [bacterium]|nr:tetratricopeptide repeat protein [bacterium]